MGPVCAMHHNFFFSKIHFFVYQKLGIVVETVCDKASLSWRADVFFYLHCINVSLAHSQ